MLFTGCCKDSFIEEENTTEQGSNLTAPSRFTLKEFTTNKSGGSGAKSRVEFTKDMHLVWSKNDTIIVFNEANDSAWYTLSSTPGLTSGTFSRKAGGFSGNQFTFVYNLGNGKNLEGDGYGKVKYVSVGKTQKAVAGSFDPTAVPMIGKAEVKNSLRGDTLYDVTMSPICAYVKVSATRDWKIAKLFNTKKLPLCSTKIDIDYSGDSIAIKPKDDNSSDTIILENLKQGKDYYFAVLPAAVGDSIITSLTNGDYGVVCIKPTDNKDLKFERNKLYIKIKFEDGLKWNKLGKVRLLAENVDTLGTNKSGTFCTYKQANDYLAHNKHLRLLQQEELLDNEMIFIYKDRFNNAGDKDILTWGEAKHEFLFEGYYANGGELQGKGTAGRIWFIGENGAAYMEYKRDGNAGFQYDPSESSKYHLRPVLLLEY